MKHVQKKKKKKELVSYVSSLKQLINARNI
jgi:hypothetical protein